MYSNLSEKQAGDKCIITGSDKYPVINDNICIGCGLCIKKCDFKALKLVNLPEALKEEPIIQFSPNSFRLFRLPIPMKGVVGLLGENGTGKTTALKILSGEIKPNLGRFGQDVDWNEIIKQYRGNELQIYLEKLAKGQIRVAYKPQQPNYLLEKFSDVDELNLDQGLMKKIGIDNLSNRKLKDLSGGELQKVAIASCLSQNADIFYLDEPSSFLDVKERLKVARVIREIAKDKSVLVVEHDLATLDFLADYIHIFYGVPGAFGVVSSLLSVKQGINTYLSGYIKEDNVKIREPIIFDLAQQQKKSKEEMVSFSDIHKDLNGFSLDVEVGTIYKNETLGVFGSNALGKTTFAKILAGVLEFNGKINKKIKISYKPQYLSVEVERRTEGASKLTFSGTVFELLSTAKNPYDKEFNPIIIKLCLENLLQKHCNKLSGGELQRVAIALCLGRDCDLYLLDEPSAYLDVEQRMSLAKLIRSMEKTFVIIDHDLLFLSYVSDMSMLFSGQSGKYGCAKIYELKQGLNQFLKELDITFRRDNETKRLRANKPNSVKDVEQKRTGNYFANTL